MIDSCFENLMLAPTFNRRTTIYSQKAVKREVKKAEDEWMIGKTKVLDGAKANLRGFWRGL